MLENDRRALLFGLAAVLAWSTVATAFKLALRELEVIQLLAYASFCSAVALLGIVLLRGQGHLLLVYLRQTPGYFCLMALLNPLAYYLILFRAYDLLPAQQAQTINYTWAIMLALLAVPVLGQRLTLRMGLGICIGYLGVVVLLSQGRFDTLPDVDWLGVALALGSTLIWAGYWLFNARSNTEPAALMATSFLLAIPVLLIVCLLGPGLPRLTHDTLLYGAWVGLVEMGVTFLLWQQALRRTQQAGRIGQLIFLSPFLSLLLIGSVLGETVHLTSWFGLGIIVAGLLVTGRPNT